MFDYKLIWTTLFNNALALTILVILVTSIINAFVRQRAHDKCFKDFRNCNVTLLMKDGARIEGRLKLYSSGVEVEYEQPLYDEKENQSHYSHITMHPELEANLQAVHRYYWELNPKNRRRRERSIRRSHNPSIFRRFGRALRNVVNTLRDAVNRSLSLFLGKIGGRIAGGSASGEINSVGTTLVAAASNAYDSMMEKYIGRMVIVETKEGGTLKKYEGILKEYSAKYLELLNVRFGLDREAAGARQGPQPQADRVFDMITPRALTTLRHAGKKDKLTLKELLGLDEFSAQ